MSYQKFIFVGNLGKDPEKRIMQDGGSVTSFSVAVNKRYKNKEGENVDKTTWFQVSVFGKQADSCAEYLSKGSQVLIDGEVQDGYAYIPEGGGDPRVINKIRANNVRFLNMSSIKLETEEDYY